MYSFRHGGGAAALLLLLAFGAAGCSNSAPSDTARTSPGLSQPKAQAGGGLPCEPTSVAAVAVVQSGVTASALSTLSPPPLAVVDDNGTGNVAFFHSVHTPASNAALFTGAYQTVPDDPSLQSCDTLLADRPAAQPFITAAIAASVADGMASSAASLRANLSGIEIGDNPLVAGSLVVVLVIDGGPQGTTGGITIDGPNTSIIVILNQASMAVTGISQGSW
jgi:hypothetical protein